MELKQLRQFYEVCKRGSFSAAGESLYMTQQAVGKSMKLLEDELAVVLFIRGKTGVSLTPQGEYLLSRCQHIFDYVQETENQIQQIGANCPIRTRISLEKGISEQIDLYRDTFAAPIFNSPLIEPIVGLEETNSTKILEQGGAAITVIPDQSEDLLSYPLMNIPLCVAVADSDRSITKKELTLKDFRQKNLIVMSNWVNTMQRLSRAFKEQNVRTESILYVNRIEDGLSMAAEGKGMFLLSGKDFELLNPSGVRKIPVKKHSLSINLYFVFRKNDNCQKEIIRVYDYLKVRLLQ